MSSVSVDQLYASIQRVLNDVATREPPVILLEWLTRDDAEIAALATAAYVAGVIDAGGTVDVPA